MNWPKSWYATGYSVAEMEAMNDDGLRWLGEHLEDMRKLTADEFGSPCVLIAKETEEELKSANPSSRVARFMCEKFYAMPLWLHNLRGGIES